MINLNLSEYSPISTEETPNKSGGWLNYGKKNDVPEYLYELTESAAVHGVLCRRIADMIAGKGVKSTNQARVDELKIYEAIKNASSDDEIQGGFYIKVHYNNDGTYNHIRTIPFDEVRLSFDVDTEEINGVWVSKDWKNTRKKANTPIFYPLFDPAKRPLATNNYVGQAMQVLPVFFGRRGKDKYPKPAYWGAINDIETIRQMSLYHANTYLNGMFPSFIINFKNGIPEKDQIETVKQEFANQLEGAKNTGKYIINFSEPGTEAPDIQAFPMTEANTSYLTISREQAMENLFIGHSVTTPRLFGITTTNNGLASNANEMKEGLKIMVSTVIEPRQRNIIEAFEKILSVEGNIKIELIPNTPIDLSEPTPQVPVQTKMKREMSPDEEKTFTQRLESIGETIDLDEWELVSECEAAHDSEGEELSAQRIQELTNEFSLKFANEGSYANGDEKSKWGDAGLYKLRYAYSQDIKDNSREFCKRMVALSLAGKVFRYEDINAMGSDGVNGQFAPTGESTYDIFAWKGGVYCHHFWKRQIYFRKRDKNGSFLPNDGLKNDVRVANVPYVPQKGVEGVKPIDTPTRGSLKD